MYTEQIDLSMNKLFGIVPSELGSMSSLRKCQYPFQVKICDEIVLITHNRYNFHQWSERIVLSDNNLFSTIPTELGLLSQLDYLDLGSNQLTGTIPDSLGSLRSLGM